MVAVAEIASSSGGGAGPRVRARNRTRAQGGGVADSNPVSANLNMNLQPMALLLAVALVPALHNAHAQALPQGGVAVHGGVSTNYGQANKLVVTTTNGAGTQHSATNWNSFNIGAGAATQINQPSAASMSINRVVTNTPSQLFGTLQSNGRVVLVNQSGIAVGAGALVDTAGFTASTLGMTNADAMAGRLRFAGGDFNTNAGALTVAGNIISRGGDVVLIAPSIDLAKTAVVESQGGSVALAAGQSVEITGRGLEGITLQVQAPADQALNLGSLKGDAVGIFAGTLRHSGLIQAVTANLQGGKVVLRATGDAYVEGDGQVLATGTAAGAKGGSVDVLGHRVAVADNALIDVSGQSGGGNIRVGGGFQGKDADVTNAGKSYFGPNASLKADAHDNGNGGKIIVWADEQTRGHGSISAHGGPNGGDGGFVEVSGKHRLAFSASVDTLAPHGKTGTLLLDPNFIDVAIGGVATLLNVDQFADFGVNLTIDPATINAAAANVVLQANNDVNILDPISMANPGVGLTARAGGFLYVNANVTTKGGQVSLTAGDTGSLTSPNEGALYVQGAIDTTGAGAFPTGANISLTSHIADVGGNSMVLLDNLKAGALGTVVLNGFWVDQLAGTITAGNLVANMGFGNIVLNQNNVIASDVSLQTASGTINFKNTALGSVNVSGLSATGNVTVVAGGALTFDAPVNSGGTLNITAPGGMAFGDDIDAANLALNSSVGSGAITQNTGGRTVAPTGSFAAGTGAINFNSNSNNFNSVTLGGGAITLRDTNALVVSILSNGANKAVDLQAGGFLTLPAAAINTGAADLHLQSGTGVTTAAPLSGANIFLQSTTGGTNINHNVNASGLLSVAANNGNVVQNATSAVHVGGMTTVAAPGGSINLTGLGTNTFGGAVNFSSSGATSLTAASNVDLGAVAVGGALNVLASNFQISQSSSATVGGASTFNSGANGDVLLGNIGNDFNTVSVTGRHISLVDKNGLAVTSLTHGSAGNVYLQAGASGPGALTIPGQSINTSGQVSLLANSASLSTNGAINAGGTVLFFNSGGGVNLAHNITAPANNAPAGLQVFATGGAVTQTAGVITAPGTATFSASGSVTLNQSNNFNNINVTAGGAASITDSVGGINTVNLTATSATVTSPGQIAGGLINTSGSINVNGGSIGMAVGSELRLNPGTGTVSLTANIGDIYVQQTTGTLDMAKYTVSAPGVGRDVLLRGSAVSGDGILVSFANFNANTSNDNIAVLSDADNSSVTVSGGSVSAKKLFLGATGSNSGVLVNGTLNMTATQDANLFSLQGNVNITGALNIASPQTNLAAGGNVLGGGAVNTKRAGADGGALNAVANASGFNAYGTFIPTGSGGIDLGNIDTSGAPGTNSVSALVATGKNGGNVTLVANGSGTISIPALQASGAPGGESSGVGMPGGKGGNVLISGPIVNVHPGGFIETLGGNGGSGTGTGTGGGGGRGGDAGSINATSTVGILHLANTGLLAEGGNGGTAGGGASVAGAGGNGGFIGLTGTIGLTLAGSAVDSGAGIGGNGTQAGAAGGAGGDAGYISVQTLAGDLTLGGFTALGANGGYGGNAFNSATTAVGGAKGNAGQIDLIANGNLTFTGLTSIVNAAAFDGGNNLGANSGISSPLKLVKFTATNGVVSQNSGATIGAAGVIIEVGAPAGSVLLQDPANQFGQMNGIANGDLKITGLEGIGGAGMSAGATLGLTGIASKPFWIFGNTSGADVEIFGDYIQLLNGNGVMATSTLKLHALQQSAEVGSIGRALDLQVGSLNAPQVTLMAPKGSILQSGTNVVNAASLTVQSGGFDVILANPLNGIDALGVVGQAANLTVKTASSLLLNGIAASGSAVIEALRMTSPGNISATLGNVVLFAHGGVMDLGNTTVSAGGQVNLTSASDINLTNTVLTAGAPVGAAALAISTQNGKLIASGADIGGVAGNWQTFLANYAGGGHVFGPFDPLVNADYRQVGGNFNAPQGMGNGSLWLDPGALTATLTGNIAKTYDGTTALPGFAAALGTTAFVSAPAYLFGELPANLSTATATLASPNAGAGIGVTMAPVTLDNKIFAANGTPTYGYTLAAAGNIGTVNAVGLGIVSLNGRQYDGTNIVNAGIFSLAGLLNGDSLALSGFGTLADKNVGVNKVVNPGISGSGGLTLGNGTGLASNYTLGGGTRLATITAKDITTVTGITAANKTYDGTAAATLNTVAAVLNGKIAGDLLTVGSASGAFTDKNAALGKTINITGIGLAGADAGNYNLLVTSANTSANIAKATITGVGGIAVNGKVYDGNTSATLNTGTAGIAGKVAGDDLVVVTANAAFSDRNAGTGKTVNINNITLGGTDSGNYFTGSYTSTSPGNIAQLAQVNWVGGVNGQWSTAANWAGGALPDGINVLAVNIPAGSQVTFNSGVVNTQLQNINSLGGVIITSGNLQVGDTLKTRFYDQTGGLLGGAGKLQVTDGFTKLGGVINMGGLVEINQTSGNLSVGGIAAGNILLNAANGGITETGPLATTGVLAAHSAQAMVLNAANNNLDAVVLLADNGNVELTNVGAIKLIDVGARNGNIKVNNTGGVVTRGKILAPNGNILVVANSPLTVLADSQIAASGNVDLIATNQTSSGDMLINGQVTSGGNINLGAANNLTQNGQLVAVGGINAFAGGAMSFGPLAISRGNPVNYRANGTSVLPPPGSLIELLARSNGTGSFINTFLNRFEDELESRQVAKNDTPGKKKKDDITVEGETCRP